MLQFPLCLGFSGQWSFRGSGHDPLFILSSVPSWTCEVLSGFECCRQISGSVLSSVKIRRPFITFIAIYIWPSLEFGHRSSVHVTESLRLDVNDVDAEARSSPLLFPPFSKPVSEESLSFRCNEWSSPRSLTKELSSTVSHYDLVYFFFVSRRYLRIDVMFWTRLSSFVGIFLKVTVTFRREHSSPSRISVGLATDLVSSPSTSGFHPQESRVSALDLEVCS